MTRNEFKIGDIIILRNGDLGVYLESAGTEYILYQDGGFDFLDPNINEDLTSYDEPDFDIMQVYRNEYCPISFTDYDDDCDTLIYERDLTWVRPSEEERAERRRIAKEKYETEAKAYAEQVAEAQKDLIFIIAQGFYGNRTGTEIRRDGVKCFLKGFTSYQEISDPMAVKYIRVPGSDNLVIVYDEMQEDDYLNVKFPEQLARSGADYLERWGEEMKPWVSCAIPEMGIELHTRCFACRIDGHGNLQSLEDNDGEKLMKFFPVK